MRMRVRLVTVLIKIHAHMLMVLVVPVSMVMVQGLMSVRILMPLTDMKPEFPGAISTVVVQKDSGGTSGHRKSR